MPWCPKCKNEYRAGVEICADCGVELVEEEQFKNQVPLIWGEKDELEELRKYLLYNKIRAVEMREGKEEHIYELFVLEEDQEKALKMGRIFMEQRVVANEQNLMENNDEKDGSVKKVEHAKEANRTVSQGYRNSSEKAEENRSAAWALLTIGVCGLVFLILCWFDVIPLNIGGTVLFYGVMSGIFILFIVSGIISAKNARKYEQNAVDESKLYDEMVKWYQNNLKAEQIDAEWKTRNKIPVSNLPAETLYFERIEILKEKFNHKFTNIDQGFLERMLDEEVYDHIFQSRE